MTLGGQNAVVYGGDDFILSFSITDQSGNPASLTGATFVWSLTATPGGNLLVQKTSAAGIAVAGSVVSVTVSHTDTAGYRAPYWHQLVMTDSTGVVTTLATGIITFQPRV